METYRLEALGALGDPTRRLIFETLAAGPLSVGELAQRLPVSRPAVSQHLRTLKDAGLVIDRPAGTRRIYQVNPAGLGTLRAYLDQIWGIALAAYATAVEADKTDSDVAENPQTDPGTREPAPITIPAPMTIPAPIIVKEEP